MRKIVSKNAAVLMTVCLLTTVAFAILFGTGSRAQTAYASSPQQSGNPGAGLVMDGYNLDNLIPFRDFSESQGYIIKIDSANFR